MNMKSYSCNYHNDKIKVVAVRDQSLGKCIRQSMETDSIGPLQLTDEQKNHTRIEDFVDKCNSLSNNWQRDDNYQSEDNSELSFFFS